MTLFEESLVVSENVSVLQKRKLPTKRDGQSILVDTLFA